MDHNTFFLWRTVVRGNWHLGSVLCLLFFQLCTSGLFSILENQLIGFAEDSILIAVVPSPVVWVTVAESLNRDLDRVSDWCNLYGIKLNANKTDYDYLKVAHNASPVTPLNYYWNCAEEVWWLWYIGSDLIPRLSLRSTFVRLASQRLGILRKFGYSINGRLFLGRFFRSFALPVLEYYSAVWCSAADAHLKLQDRIVSGACVLTDGVFECNIFHIVDL